MKRIKLLRIGQVVGLGFGLILFLALLIGLFGRIAYDISRWQRGIIETRSEVERLTLELEILSIQRTNALRRYLETDDVNQLANYQTTQSAYADTHSRLAMLLNAPQETEALQTVVVAEAEFSDKAREILDLYGDRFPAAARFLWDSEGLASQDKLLDAIGALRKIQGDTSTSIINQARQTERLAILAVSVFIPLGLFAGIGISLFITRNITRPISSLVNAVSHLGTDLTARVNPSGPRETAFLGEAINDMADSLLHSSRSLQEYKERLEQELTMASQMQASFLPVILPKLPNLELAVFWKSARQMGGDFYAFIDLDKGQRGIAVGDVSGKGAPAAMAGALSVGLLEAYALNYPRPEELLAELNQDISSRLASQYFNVACCYAILDTCNYHLTVANAGCMYPYLRRNNSLQEINVGGMPLGAWPGFEYSAKSLPLQPGDLLIFSSDGLVEAQNKDGELLGFDRLRAALLALPSSLSAQAAVDRLVALAMDFMEHGELHDDITILVARILAD